MSVQWAYAGASFYWLRQEVNGVIVLPRWKRQPVLNRHQFAGSEETAILRLGIGPYTISGPIWIPNPDDAQIFEDNNGALNVADDLTGNSWGAVLEFDINGLSPSPDGGYTGTITLTRPSP